MSKRTCVVTGANRGIGLAMVRQLTERGDDVIAVCRKPSAELESSGARIVSGVDVTTDEGIEKLTAELPVDSVDVLINNAGLLRRTSLDDLQLDSVRQQFEVNALGPLRVTAALAPRLSEGAKVGIVTSRMGSVEDNTSGSHYGYRMSKAAVNMAGRSLAHDLAPRGVAVVLLHPGYVRTEMTGNSGHIEPAEAAAGLLARIDDLTLESSGSFFHQNGERLPW